MEVSQKLLLIVSATAVCAIAADVVSAKDQIDYSQQIKPIFAKRCYACHGALKQEAGLRLDTAALAIRGGEAGPVIRLGDPEASVLIQRVTADDESEKMPPIGEALGTPQC